MKIGQYLTFNIPKKALYLYNLTIRNENTYVPNLTFPVVFLPNPHVMSCRHNCEAYG